MQLEKLATQLTAVTADPYWQAWLVWLEGKPDNTRRSYYRAIQALLDFLEGKHFRHITPLDVARWKEELKRSGARETTINQRLSAVSSYYQFLQRPQPDGSILHQVNPVKGVERKDIKVSDYSNAKKVSVKQFQAILAVIDGTRPSGALYKAAFLFYVLCGRRRREVLALYGRDIRANEQTVEYRATLKGGKRKWKELPPPVWADIQHYLAVAGRTLSDDSPMFVGTAKYRRKSEATTELKPMTGTTLLYAIKRYAKKAGIDPQKVSLHSLRHLGAELFLEASGDIHETQIFLDHAHLNTTQIYLSQLKGKKHRHWQAMANELALG